MVRWTLLADHPRPGAATHGELCTKFYVMKLGRRQWRHGLKPMSSLKVNDLIQKTKEKAKIRKS